MGQICWSGQLGRKSLNLYFSCNNPSKLVEEEKFELLFSSKLLAANTFHDRFKLKPIDIKKWRFYMFVVVFYMDGRDVYHSLIGKSIKV